MENNDSNIKPQQIGGLKLMTVFVLVIVAHVVVLGGITAYCLMKGSSADSDILTDLTHKNAKGASDVATTSENPSTDANQADKAGTAPVASTETASSPTPTSAAPQTPPAESIASTDTGAPSTVTSPIAVNPTPASAPAPVVAQHGPVFVPPQVVDKPMAASNPVVAPEIQTPTSGSLNGTPYVVKAGDSVAKIAHRNHTSVAKLKAANGLTSDMLHIGQKMIIPAKTDVASATPSAANAPDSGSTTILADSAKAPSMSVPAPAAKVPATAPATNLAAPAPASTIAGEGHTYTVIKGDTLTKIAHKFKTTPTAIMAANSLTDATKLSIGKKLKIPGRESRSATTVSAPVTTPTTTTTPAPASQPSQVQVKADTTAQLANFIQ